MSALAAWLQRWLPIAIHGAMRSGARPEAVAGALGCSLDEAYCRWHEWASRQRDFIINGKPDVTEDECCAVARLPWTLGSLAFLNVEQHVRPVQPLRRTSLTDPDQGQHIPLAVTA
jgi:hypothetical protein